MRTHRKSSSAELSKAERIVSLGVYTVYSIPSAAYFPENLPPKWLKDRSVSVDLSKNKFLFNYFYFFSAAAHGAEK